MKSSKHISPLAAIERDIEAGKMIVIDGATGTELERRGVKMHEDAWCAMATLTDPELVRNVHEDYIRSGARVITTNTFATNRNMLEPAGLASRVEQLNRRAVELALEARERTGMQEQVADAGSMSQQIPLLIGTDHRDTEAIPASRVAKINFEEMAGLLAAGGVDLILMEMMSDPNLANLAITAAVATGLPVWVGFSMRPGKNGEPISYSRHELSASEMLDMIPLDGVRVAGVMHSEVDVVGLAIELLKQRWSGPLMVYPESGHFKMPNWQFVDIISIDDFITYNRRWIADGVQIVGGCCGLGVEHIASLTAALTSSE